MLGQTIGRKMESRKNVNVPVLTICKTPSGAIFSSLVKITPLMCLYSKFLNKTNSSSTRQFVNTKTAGRKRCFSMPALVTSRKEPVGVIDRILQQNVLCSGFVLFYSEHEGIVMCRFNPTLSGFVNSQTYKGNRSP